MLSRYTVDLQRRDLQDSETSTVFTTVVIQDNWFFITQSSIVHLGTEHRWTSCLLFDLIKNEQGELMQSYNHSGLKEGFLGAQTHLSAFPDA